MDVANVVVDVLPMRLALVISVLSFPCKYLLLIFTLLLLLYQEHNRGRCCFIYRLVDETKAINSEGGIFSYL